MDNFKILLNDDMEYHFKMAIKSFDPNSIITHNEKENSYYVKTNISILDLKALTSVKKVTEVVISSEQQNFYDIDYYN